MKICLISDIHGDLTYLKACGGVMQDADVVVVCGDITHFGGRREAEAVLDELSIYNDAILGVIGNCDTREVAEELTAREINLHAAARRIGGITFYGMEGSLSGPASTPTTYSEDQLKNFLESAQRSVEDSGGNLSRSILVCHTPPYGGATDRVMRIKHIGSRSLRYFLETAKVPGCVCGHAHEAKAEERIGETIVVNPGSFRSGNYAVIDITVPDDEKANLIVDAQLQTADHWK